MYGSFRAELLKLRKRLAVWILGALWLAIVMFFLYLLPVLFLTANFVESPPEGGVSLEEQLPTLAPENLSVHLLRYLFPGLGMTLAIILGALAAIIWPFYFLHERRSWRKLERQIQARKG